MTIAKAGIIGLTMFILYRIFSKGSAASNLNFEIGKVAYAASGAGFLLTFFIVVKNVSNEQILLNSLNGDIFFNGKLLGQVENKLEIYIAKKGETTLPIAVNLFYMPIVDTIIDLIQGKITAASIFNFKGTAKVEGLDFPVDLKYSLA